MNLYTSFKKNLSDYLLQIFIHIFSKLLWYSGTQVIVIRVYPIDGQIFLTSVINFRIYLSFIAHLMRISVKLCWDL